MQLINIKDLEVGDEILISCQSYFKYLRILQKPKFGTRKHWNTGNLLYKSVKCSTRRVEKITSYMWNNQSYSRTTKEWEITPEEHNYTHYVNLEDRQMILVKKNKN